MPKLTMMSGLPASGKTTKSKEIIKESGNTVRLNRDLLREMLHFGKWSPMNEKTIIQTEKDMAFDLLVEGHNVIIDDTNLGDNNYDMWKEIAEKADASFLAIRMDATLDECLERNEHREGRVPPHVIKNFALQYNMVEQPPEGWIICDLDGTLCDIKHRLGFVHQDPKDWGSFFAGIPMDTVRKEVEQQLYDASKFPDLHDVIFVSARPETYRLETEKWLALNCAGINYYTLIMPRGADDRRPDVDLKQQVYNKYFKDKNVRVVFDDRPRVIEMWRSNGLNVVDVGDGVDF